jgi:hypothetical protein
MSISSSCLSVFKTAYGLAGAETEEGMREVGIYLHVDWCRDLKRGVREKQVSSTTSPRSSMQTFPNLP